MTSDLYSNVYPKQTNKRTVTIRQNQFDKSTSTWRPPDKINLDNIRVKYHQKSMNYHREFQWIKQIRPWTHLCSRVPWSALVGTVGSAWSPWRPPHHRVHSSLRTASVNYKDTTKISIHISTISISTSSVNYEDTTKISIHISTISISTASGNYKDTTKISIHISTISISTASVNYKDTTKISIHISTISISTASVNYKDTTKISIHISTIRISTASVNNEHTATATVSNVYTR